MASPRAPLLSLVALALLALLVLLSPGASAAGPDVAKCNALVAKLGGVGALVKAAPKCTAAIATSASKALQCCSQIKALLAKTGKEGAKCFCNATVFNGFISQVSLPGVPVDLIPMFLTDYCKIAIPGSKSCPK